MGTRWITYLRRSIALAWFASLCALLGLALASHVAPHTGHTLLIIRGASMEPAIPLGALVALRSVDSQSVSIGDIVTTRADNGVLVTHRVAEIVDPGAERLLRLRGDANPTPDTALVPAAAVVGRVSSFAPLAGYALFLLSVPSGILACLSMLGALLLAYWLVEDMELAARATKRPPSAARPPARARGVGMGR